MSRALQYHISNVNDLIDQAGIDSSFTFSGFDSSAAPSKNYASMVEVYEQMGVEYFGASGTVEASALLTNSYQISVLMSLAGVAAQKKSKISQLILEMIHWKNFLVKRTSWCVCLH